MDPVLLILLAGGAYFVWMKSRQASSETAAVLDQEPVNLGSSLSGQTAPSTVPGSAADALQQATGSAVKLPGFATLPSAKESVGVGGPGKPRTGGASAPIAGVSMAHDAPTGLSAPRAPAPPARAAGPGQPRTPPAPTPAPQSGAARPAPRPAAQSPAAARPGVATPTRQAPTAGAAAASRVNLGAQRGLVRK